MLIAERQEHNVKSPWWGEHIYRYIYSLKFISSKDNILDIACGNGFGSYLLSQKTTGIVIGADVSPEAIEYCSSLFPGQENLKFQIVDGTKMRFADEHFDLIISFETIEHTTEYNKMLKEFYRTLKRGGKALISTPNFIVNSPNGVIKNPFHTQEFRYNELSQILTSVFDNVIIMGQKYARYSNKSIAYYIVKQIENILYLRGVRKLPISFRNFIMQLIIKKNLYPAPDDFEMSENYNEIIKCKTFFAICSKT